MTETEVEILQPTIEYQALVQALEFLGLDANRINAVDITYSGVWVQYLDRTATDLDDYLSAVYYRLV